MQSGISASRELHAAFRSLLTSPDAQRGLLVDIKGEQLVPGDFISMGSGSDFYSDLSSVSSRLTPTQAAYIVLRRHPASETDAFVAVTYVPDTAPIRQKMLFASTRLTLVRELGVERFRETLFATDTKELTAEGWKAHEAHGELAAPLTEEEQGQRTLKEAEDEEGARIGTGGRRSHVLGAGMDVGVGVNEALKALGESGSANNLVQLKLDVAKESIQLVEATSVPAAQLSTSISSTEPRYAYYRFEHEYEGRSLAPIIFLYTCPTESKVKERMVYASSRSYVSGDLASSNGLTIDKKLEASTPSDFTEKSIWEEFHPPVQARSGFARPKRPGKR